MTFDFSTTGKVKVSMDHFIDKLLKGFPKEMFETVSSPAAEHLFKVHNENKWKVLPEEQGSMYHHIVDISYLRHSWCAVTYILLWHF